MKDIVLAQDVDSMTEYTQTVNALEQEVFKNFEIINERFLGEKEKYKTALKAFTDWKPIRDEVISLMHEGKRVAAANIIKGEDVRHVVGIERAMEELGQFTHSKAKDFLLTAKMTKVTSFRMMYFLIGLSVLAAILLSLFITKSITAPIGTLRTAVDDIGKGKLDTRIDMQSKDEIGHLAASFNRMTKDLRNVTASRDELNEEILLRKKSEEALQESEARYHDLYDNAPDMFVSVDAKTATILQCNQTLATALGYRKEEIVGRPIFDVYHPDCMEDVKKSFQLFVETGEVHNAELQLKRKNGSKIDVILNVSAIFDEQGEVLYSRSVWRDITDRKQLEEEIKATAITDDLTGLLNRRGFLRFAQKQIEIANREKTNFSLLYLDLNDMKIINDEFGHLEGDRALKYIANILNKTFRSSDIIARVGGDEFAILITGARGSATERTVIDNLIGNLSNYDEDAERGYTLSVSTGIAHYDPAHPCSLEDLLLRADALMYENKQRYQFAKAGLKQPKKISREKRIDKRYDVENKHKIELVVPDSIRIVNISMNGIRLETRQRLAKNTAFTIRISPHNEEEEILLTGFVVWSTVEAKVTEEGIEGTYNQAGLRFVGTDDSSKDLLKKYLTDLRKGNFTLSLFQ
jgi:diguanylate cyclase (GGDEF)-like protein/PAS domain S-box-containing protein